MTAGRIGPIAITADPGNGVGIALDALDVTYRVEQHGEMAYFMLTAQEARALADWVLRNVLEAHA